MRRFILLYSACACVFAGTVEVSATCDGVTYSGVNSVSCGNGPNVEAQGLASPTYLAAMAGNLPGHTASASAAFDMDFIFTVFGGTGDGSAEPALSASGYTQGSKSEAAGSVTISNSGGELCEAGYNGNPFGYTTCTPTSLTFTFGVPQTVTISANAWAYTGPMYAADVSGGASYGGFYTGISGVVTIGTQTRQCVQRHQ